MPIMSVLPWVPIHARRSSEQPFLMQHGVARGESSREGHHLQLQKQLVLDLHFQSLLVLLVLVLTEKKAPMVEQLLLMI